MSPQPYSSRSFSLVIVADVGTEPFHVGDEAMLLANVEALRRHNPEVRVTVIGREAGGDAGGPGATAALEGADGLFLSGGGNLSSTWPDLLHQRIRWIGEARRRGLPVVTGGQTIGPVLSPTDRSALAEALAGVDLLGIRDLPSVALALQMGAHADRLSYQPDDAFFLAGRPPTNGGGPDEPFLLVTLDPAFAATGSRPGLSSLALQLAAIAAESRLRLAFLPHLGSLGSLGDEDGQAGAALAELLRAEGVELALLPVMPPAETVWVAQRAAAVVSSRYHPLVFATAAAVPCVGIYRDDYTRIKLQGALAHLGMEAWCQSAADAERFGLIGVFRRLWSWREEIAAAMTRARAPLVAQEERRWRQLLARLGRTRGSGEPPWSLLGWPAERADRLAEAALSALVLERQASEAEAAHWRGVVNRMEQSVDLAVQAAQAVEGRQRRIMEETRVLTEQQWNDYSRDGFLHLGKIMEPEELEALRKRADDLALGTVKNPDVQMQLDTGGVYEELPQAVRAFEHGTRLYRKIQGLETDDLFVRLVKHPLCMEICARQYGPHAPISIFRAMVMNKPAGQGTVLPWHQDGGNVWALDRDPLVTVWVALDSATRANGCLEVIPGTHRLGLLSLYGSTVAEEHVRVHCPPERVLPLEVEAGHAVLLHNWLIHRSGVNPTSVPRRAFTVCYMDGRTQSTLTGNFFPLIAGSIPIEPYPYLHQLRSDCAMLREMATRKMWKIGLHRLRSLLYRVRDRVVPARS